MSELVDFEEFAAEAMRQGFTVHLNHYRFHPDHTAKASFCVSRIELKVIPITEEAQARCPGKRGHWQSREYDGERIGDVLLPAWEFLRPATALPDPIPNPIVDSPHCAVEGCESPIFAKGICSRHYQQDYRCRRRNNAA